MCWTFATWVGYALEGRKRSERGQNRSSDALASCIEAGLGEGGAARGGGLSIGLMLAYNSGPGIFWGPVLLTEGEN